MTAAAADPARAAARVSVVSAIGYLAFLGGPPIVGALAEHEGVLRALVLVPVAMSCSVALASATRE